MCAAAWVVCLFVFKKIFFAFCVTKMRKVNITQTETIYRRRKMYFFYLLILYFLGYVLKSHVALSSWC